MSVDSERRQFPITVEIDRVWLPHADGLTPAEAFQFAEQVCAAAYQCQGGPAPTPEAQYDQLLAREARNATTFEHLYCKMRDIADAFHREAIRRNGGKEPGQYFEQDLDPVVAMDGVLGKVLSQILDWDY